jgi:anti-anti-sigma factor
VDVQEQERGRLLVLRGRLDARAAPDVRQALHRLVDTGSGPALVEVSELLLVDLGSLGLLLEAHRRAERSGRRLVLVAVPAPLDRVLRATRLDRVLRRTEDTEDTDDAERARVPEAATA